MKFDNKTKGNFLPFVDLRKLEDVVIKCVQSKIKLCYTQNKQWEYYGRVVI